MAKVVESQSRIEIGACLLVLTMVKGLRSHAIEYIHSCVTEEGREQPR